MRKNGKIIYGFIGFMFISAIVNQGFITEFSVFNSLFTRLFIHVFTQSVRPAILLYFFQIGFGIPFTDDELMWGSSGKDYSGNLNVFILVIQSNHTGYAFDICFAVFNWFS